MNILCKLGFHKYATRILHIQTLIINKDSQLRIDEPKYCSRCGKRL